MELSSFDFTYALPGWCIKEMRVRYFLKILWWFIYGHENFDN
ncbi:MAG TPA: hypothetical protein DDW32_00180 [Thermotoga sp.]|uniref:Uncharacterized protein n=1 Tax=Thermotoga maritima (strain ATCC 43589 / DSM 3109 / JCM 10099 / NBRC 100826 / MSB8) TaxID=243274 RepID=Q9X111_THEMA|nr:hypothetical protein TM_1285 [Thermotoga maritima MSB8]AKE27194.1 hypothetical protein THMC_1311 [Thermotoga maritima]HAA82126.1 hypothetical protein [Thermotoga petrophila]HBF68958.1 hypothetical protein [Thermotoga sp.]AGL50215.1 hypothetical protein Tmari_1291 [Thermotoga maritima MSB8]